MMRNTKQLRANRRRGSAVVEFALVVPILLSILIGIMEFGVLTNNQLELANAAREGARSGALGRSQTDVRTRIKTVARPFVVADADITFQYSIDNGATYYTTWPADNTATDPDSNTVPTGALLRVTIMSPNRPLTGFFPFLKNKLIKTTATYRREV